MELSEIIKGLRCCSAGEGCGSCPLEYPFDGCIDNMMGAAADALEMQRNHIVALTEQLEEARNEQS